MPEDPIGVLGARRRETAGATQERPHGLPAKRKACAWSRGFQRARGAGLATACSSDVSIQGVQSVPEQLHRAALRPGPTVAAKGFRPFFLLAGVFAASIVPLWMLSLLGVLQPGAYLDATYWHAHEMVFGFAVAVIAGFLLTAVANWTERETLVGRPLLALAGLWLVGRVVLLFPAALPRWVPALADLAFLPVLFAVLARPLLAARNARNFVMLGVVGALFVANAMVHLDVLGVLPGYRRRGCLMGVDVVVLVMLLLSGRIFPLFTRNATEDRTIRSHPRLDALTAVSMMALVVLDATADAPRAAAALAAATAALAAARSVHWGGRQSARQPLLWVLHLGHAWIPVGLGLRAASTFFGLVPASLATHALTVGAIGTLTLGMMSRVALGHTGRPMVPPRGATIAFFAITLAALARISGGFLGGAGYRATVYAAGSLWTVAFAAFTVAYAGALVAARIDGRPG